MPGKKSGFTILEMMIVVTIIGVVSSIAIPAYFSYVSRAQIAEAVGLLWSAKSPMADAFADTGRWPASPDLVMGTTSGKYTASVTYYGEPDNAPPGGVTLMATLNSFGIAPELRNTTFVLSTSDGGVHWRCTSGGANPVADSALPGACR
jgi:type IV pilus assembly protein PilA